MTDFKGPAAMCIRCVAGGGNRAAPSLTPRMAPRRSVEGAARRKAKMRAEQRAKTKIARKYQDEYEILVVEELERDEVFGR